VLLNLCGLSAGVTCAWREFIDDCEPALGRRYKKITIEDDNRW
jgi:hypothetical protein